MEDIRIHAILAAMPPDTESSARSPKRRTLLAVLGAGLCAAIGGVVLWRPGSSFTSKPLSSLPPVPKLKVDPMSDPSAGAIEAPSPEAGQPMSREWFLPHLHSKFQMHAEILSSAAVELIDVGPSIPITDKDHHINYTSFSLVFKGAEGMPKESQVYHLDHEKLGKMDLFLSPIGRYKDQVRYEAVFSHRV